MDLGEALARIEAIDEHVARCETYRGYHPWALALSGVFGLVGMFFEPVDFVEFWSGLALLAGLVAGAPTLVDYLWRESPAQRGRTRLVWRQFAPCLLAGIACTVAFARADLGHRCLALLPGCWALIFGLGVVASLPYLPRFAVIIALWYLVAGCFLLLNLTKLSGWAVGIPFGIGQLLSAVIIWRDREANR